MEDKQFCTSCGKEFDYQTPYCPACGAPAGGTAPVYNSNTPHSGLEAVPAEKTFKLAMVLMFIGAAVMLWVAWDILSSMDAAIDELIKALNDAATLTPQQIAEVTDTYRAILTAVGYMSLIGGIFAAVTGVMILMRKMWVVVFICALIASICGFVTIIGGFIGIYLCWNLYKYKEYFETAQKNNL